MKIKEKLKQRFYLILELWNYMRVRKKWWLLPIITMILIVSVLIIASQFSAISPFIYALF